MLKRKIDVHIKDKSVRTYIVLKVLKEDESMIRFVGTDTSGEVALLNMLDNFLHKIRLDVADEWTYCAHCHTYVKTSDRKIINNGNGTYNVACGNCGGYHFINKKS